MPHRYTHQGYHISLRKCARCLVMQPPGFEGSLGFCDSCLEVLRMSREEYAEYEREYERRY